jgi:hypothetical protein
MSNSKVIFRNHLDGFSFLNSTFKIDSLFSESEVNIFSKPDREKIWSPDGSPFCGEFDLYLKVYNNDIFQGFFRLEIFPWDEINLHVAFPTSNSLKSRYYLRATYFFLLMLNDFASVFNIYCLVNLENKNIISYMRYFDFERLGIEDDLIRFKFRRIEIKNFERVKSQL